MPTFIFRSKSDGKTVAGTDISQTKARDRAAQMYPPFGLHNADWWHVYECWEGGQCIWHVQDGQLIDGPRQTIIEVDPCLVKREPEEPMFILLGRDSAAPTTIEWWCQYRLQEIEQGKRPDTQEERDHITQVAEKATQFREWRRTNRN